MKTKLLIALLLLSTVYGISASYTAIVAENGNARVFLTLTGQGTANIPLPLDADNPSVQGALYIQATNGIDVNLGSSEKAVITFDSALLTEKQGDTWIFSLELTNADQTSVTFALPSKAVVTNTIPQATLAAQDNAITVVWDNADQQVQASYSFQELLETPDNLVQGGDEPATTEDNTLLLVLLLAIVLAGGAVFYYLNNKSSANGKEKVLKMLSENERLIMDLLINNDGGMKRNSLERESELAKSSLASTLHQLEKKKLIHIKNRHKVHYIALSDFFDSL